MNRRFLVLPTCAAILVAGCAGEEQSSPNSPAAATTTAERLSPPFTSAPLEVMAAAGDPCSLVSANVQQKYGMKGPGDFEPDSSIGTTCSYARQTREAPVVTVGINTVSMGLEGLYQRRSNFADFRPLEIDGYPGVIVNPRVDSGGCIIDLAVNDSDLLVVGVRLSTEIPRPPEFACEQANQIVTDVLADIR